MVKGGGPSPPAGLVVAAGLAALAGTVAVAAYKEISSARDRQRVEATARRREQESLEDADKQARLKLYMEKELENMMIVFKRNVPGGTFEEFLLNNFPENVTVDPQTGVPTCDERVRNNDWEGRFASVTGEQDYHVLGTMPM